MLSVTKATDDLPSYDIRADLDQNSPNAALPPAVPLTEICSSAQDADLPGNNYNTGIC